jgi:hypothetical protein
MLSGSVSTAMWILSYVLPEAKSALNENAPRPRDLGNRSAVARALLSARIDVTHDRFSHALASNPTWSVSTDRSVKTPEEPLSRNTKSISSRLRRSAPREGGCGVGAPPVDTQADLTKGAACAPRRSNSSLPVAPFLSWETPGKSRVFTKSIRLSDRIVQHPVSGRTRKALTLFSSICVDDGGPQARAAAWSALSRTMRARIRQYKHAEMKISQGGQSLTDSAVIKAMDEAMAVVGNSHTATSLPLDEMCEFELLVSVREKIATLNEILRPRTSLEFLRLIYKSIHGPIVGAVRAGEGLEGEIDHVAVGAARILYRASQGGAAPRDDAISVEELNRAFLREVKSDAAALRLAASYFPAIAPTHRYSSFWFDGLALRGAAGGNASTIARELGGTDSYERKLEITALWFRENQESQDYIVGTPQQSMATILLRTAETLGISIEGIADPKCLMAIFSNAAKVTQETRAFPLNLWLMAARHHARSRSVLVSWVLNKDELLTREFCTINFHVLEMLPSVDGSRASSATHDNTNGDSPIPFRCRDIAKMARGDHSLTGTSIEKIAVQKYRELESSVEVIACTDQLSCNTQTLEYFKTSLLAYQPVPAFDEAIVVDELIANAFGLTGCEAEDRHKYIYRKLVPSFPSHLAGMNRVGTLRSEFFKRRKEAIPADKKIYFRGKMLDTVSSLDNARIRFEESLKTHPVVLAKAQEILRMTGRIPTPELTASAIRSLLFKKEGRPTEFEFIQWMLQRVQMFMIVDGIRPIAQQIDTGSASDLIEMLPFLGPAYEIGKGLWDGDWTEIAEGVGRVGIDVIFLWLGGIADREIATTFEKAITRNRPMAGVTPGVSLIRDFYADCKGAGTSSLPVGMHGALEEVGPASSFELTIQEEGSGAEVTAGGISEPKKIQYRYRGPDDDQPQHSNTVRDVFSLMDTLEDAEASAQPCSSGSGFGACLSAPRAVSKPAPMVVDLSDLLQSNDPTVLALIERMIGDRSSSHLWRRFVWLARAQRMKPIAVLMENVKPGAFFESRTITLSTPEWLKGVKYMSTAGPVAFKMEDVLPHECLHFFTGFDDNPGRYRTLERGNTVAIESQINYEANIRVPPRIMYEYDRSATHPESFKETLATVQRARLRALSQDRQLDHFWEKDVYLPNYQILGTPIKERLTVSSMGDAVRLLTEDVPSGVDEDAVSALMRQTLQLRTMPGQSVVMQREFDIALVALRVDHFMFDDLFIRWLHMKPVLSKMWTFVFDVPRIRQTIVSPWSIDEVGHVVSFFSGRTRYSTPYGPQDVSMKRSIVALIVELVSRGKLPKLSAIDAKVNVGPKALLVDLILNLDEAPSRAVSGAYAVEDESLWNDIFYAAKAEHQEKIFMRKGLLRMSALHDS